MIVTICCFLKSSIHISAVQCNTLLNKNYVAHSNNCSLCERLNLRKKKFVCTLWLLLHMKSVVEEGFFHEFA